MINLALGLNDLGNADKFKKLHHGKVWYCPDSKQWMAWDGVVWAPCSVYEHGKEVLKYIMDSIDTMEEVANKQAIVKHLSYSHTEHGFKAMLSLAAIDKELQADNSKFDYNPDVLACGNGVVDLRTSRISDSTPELMLTMMTDTPYNPAAKCPLWLEFIEKVCLGDKKLESYLHKALGYSITGHTGEQCFFIVDGPGANGKSTMAAAIRDVVGPFVAYANPSTFQKRNRQATNDIARLNKRRVIITTEINDLTLDDSLIKRLSGDDQLVARFLYKEEFEFSPTFKVWMMTNHKPMLDTDKAIWRRTRVIPFHAVFWSPDNPEHNEGLPEFKADKEFGAKLQREHEGILAWLVEGARMWYEQGLGLPDLIQSEVQRYKESNDSLTIFVKEKCVLHQYAEIPFNDLYENYTTWMEKSNDKPITKQQFKHDIMRRSSGDVSIVRKDGEWVIKGITNLTNLRFTDLTEGDQE